MRRERAVDAMKKAGADGGLARPRPRSTSQICREPVSGRRVVRLALEHLFGAAEATRAGSKKAVINLGDRMQA